MGLRPHFLSAFLIAFLMVRQLRDFALPILLSRRLGATSSAFRFFLRHAFRTAARPGTIGTSRSFPLFGMPSLPCRNCRRTRMIPGIDIERPIRAGPAGIIAEQEDHKKEPAGDVLFRARP